MDSFNINISPETQEIVITQGEPINISINEDVIQINQTKENYNLNLEGEVVKIDANYPQAVEAARIATEKAEEATQIVEGFDTHAQEKIAEYDSNASDKIAEYNQNATEKTNTFNSNATDKLGAYNDNASEKLSAYNQNDTEKTSAYNTNAQNKLDAYNLNDTSKTGAFNQNASDKTDAFNSNATSKTGDFNDNATAKTTDFNENATSKTTAFNENASEKQALVDASAQAASQSAAEAKQWAIGDPSEPTGNSAKYWAEQSAGALSGLTTRVSTIEGKIPSAASSSNQLVDKNYVDTADNGLQQQIDAITAASDVTDIVGTYAQLQAYDTSTLPNNSIIKVLRNESRNDETTYYRWVITAGVGAWSLIGEEGPYYTIASADATFQEKLVSGTNIKTINSNSILGSGNLDINGLPTQTGQSGKFLTTDGTDASWADVDALPSQTGQSGKYLTTDGSSASWATLSVNPDNKSITTNSSDELQTVGVISARDNTTAIKIYPCTKAQYDAIVTKDPNTLYNITDDTDVSLTILEALYPVGSVYITTANTCPLSALISGSTWELVSSGRVLQGADSGHSAGTTIEAGLPNITGETSLGASTGVVDGAVKTGAFKRGVATYSNGVMPSSATAYSIGFDASRSNSIYGNSTTVQSPAYVVNIYRRTA